MEITMIIAELMTSITGIQADAVTLVAGALGVMVIILGIDLLMEFFKISFENRGLSGEEKDLRKLYGDQYKGSEFKRDLARRKYNRAARKAGY